MNKSAEWKIQRNDVIKLISYYKRHKCLWDFRSNEYKRYELRKMAWQKMANVFNKHPNDIKLKIKYLRAAYGAEKRKVDIARKSNRKYRPCLYYYDNLNFLDNIIVCRKEQSLDNVDNNSSDPIAECNEQLEKTTTLDENDQHESQESADDELMLSPPSSPPSASRASNAAQLKSKTHKLTPYYSKLDNAVSILAEATNNYCEDTIYTAFGKTMALQLSQLTPLEATITMSEIHETLSECIIKSMIAKQNNRHSTENL